MASVTPAAVRNENLHTLRGKGAEKEKANVPKPVKPLRQERKALRDLSNVGKPLFSASTKGPMPKEKPATRGRDSAKKTLKSDILTHEDIELCCEWAKEGIEHMHFSGNDMQNLAKDQQEQRVRKKVNKALSGLHVLTADVWTDEPFGLTPLVQDVSSDTDDDLELEIVSEVPPWRTSTKLGNGEADDAFKFDFGIDHDHLYFNSPLVVPKLREDYGSDSSV